MATNNLSVSKICFNQFIERQQRTEKRQTSGGVKKREQRQKAVVVKFNVLAAAAMNAERMTGQHMVNRPEVPEEARLSFQSTLLLLTAEA